MDRIRKVLPGGVLGGASEGIPARTPKEIPGGIPIGLPERIPNETCFGISIFEEIPGRAPEGTSEGFLNIPP